MQTVRKISEGYTKHEVKRATTARKTLTMLGFLLEQDMKYLVSSKELDDCPDPPTIFVTLKPFLVVLIW